jgi:hypothetical protein
MDINGVNIRGPNKSFTRSEWEALAPNGCTTEMSMRDRSYSWQSWPRNVRGKVNFQECEQERTISSTALVEYVEQQMTTTPLLARATIP